MRTKWPQGCSKGVLPRGAPKSSPAGSLKSAPPRSPQESCDKRVVTRAFSLFQIGRCAVGWREASLCDARLGAASGEAGIVFLRGSGSRAQARGKSRGVATVKLQFEVRPQTRVMPPHVFPAG